MTPLLDPALTARRLAIRDALVNSLNYGTAFAEALVCECAVIGHVWGQANGNDFDMICIYCGTERKS